MTLLLGAMLFLVFSFINQNFTHQHILSDGSVVEHSHPYSGQSGKQHHHEDGEIYFLASVNSLIDQAVFTPDISIQTQQINDKTPIIETEFIKLMVLPLPILRGPPAC